MMQIHAKPPTRDPVLHDAATLIADFLRKKLRRTNEQADAIGGAVADYIAMNWGGQQMSFTVSSTQWQRVDCPATPELDQPSLNDAHGRKVLMLRAVARAAKEQLTGVGMPATEAENGGQAIAEMLAEYWAGSCIHIPKNLAYQRHLRNMDIFRRLRLGNANLLAQEYGISVQRVYQIYNRCAKERRRIHQVT